MMKMLQISGLFLFFFGILIFVISLSMNNYVLTEDVLRQSISNTNHREVLMPVYQDMLDEYYSSKFKFIDNFNQRFNDVNQSYKDNEEWEKVIWTDYTFIIVKNSSVGLVSTNRALFFWLCFALTSLGGLLYIVPEKFISSAGIKNDHIFFSSIKSRGWLGIILGTSLITFYIFLYKFPEYITNWVMMLDPVSLAISGQSADQWFLYGVMYSLVMTVMGVRMYIKYRNNNYQKLRTISVVFFQICFAFTLPQILKTLHMPAYDLKSAWPLEYTFFFDYRLDEHIAAGTFGIWMLLWGIVLFAVMVPLLTYFYGKRWYCSWVCGCGGLAETLGDPFRQLSNKSIKAWKIERLLIHSVLIYAVIMTSTVVYSYFSNSYEVLGISTYAIRDQYGFLIGFVFAGIVGTGFYPFLGNRAWCRFGCPLAAYLGIVQRFKSKFRITTNGGQCISCGNCSTYCEMGIDVRWYAQRGQNIVRSSCVGCGICSAVCPRGVLKLENRSEQGRINSDPILIGNKSIKLND